MCVELSVTFDVILVIALGLLFQYKNHHLYQQELFFLQSAVIQLRFMDKEALYRDKEGFLIPIP